MEVMELKLRLQDSIAHKSLISTLSKFHKQTQFYHTQFFDGAAGELSLRRAILRLRFFGEDSTTAQRCVASLKVKALSSSNGVVRVDQYVDDDGDSDGGDYEEEEINPFWGREICTNPDLIGSVESRVLKRVREEFGNGFGNGYVCLGGFKNVSRVYEWSGLKLSVVETRFEFGTMYEVECECESDANVEVEKVKELIEGLLKDNGIVYAASNLSKFSIFRAGKLPFPLTVNIVGNDTKSVNNKDTVSSPLWQYVTKLQKFGGGGNTSFRCNYCQGTYTGSYSRVKGHLLKIPGLGIKHCPSITAQHVEEMKRLVDGTHLPVKKAVTLESYWPSPPASSESSSDRKVTLCVASPEKELYVFKRRKKTGDTEIAPVEPAKEHLDREIARMFFAEGLPLSLSENPYYKSAFTYAAANSIPNYVPPNRSDLVNNFLKRERAELDKWIESSKRVSGQKGVTIVCSGWTYPHQSLVNIMMVAEVPMLLKVVNCGSGHEDKCIISNIIKEVIRDIGPSNVVHVITENTPICREAGSMVEKTYPQVFWIPCVAHTLDLALRKILCTMNAIDNAVLYRECSWITEVVNSVKMAKDFILQHSSSLSMFVDTPDLKVLVLSETQHGYFVLLLKRFLLMKDMLQSMMMNEKWSLFSGTDMENAQLIKEKLLSDIFWGKICYILSFTEPMYDLMKIVNSGRCCLHLMYEMWGSMISKMKTAVYYHELKEANEESVFWNALHQILQDAWLRSESPIYALAHSLNPRYSCQQWLSEDPNHLPPHRDPKISLMRNACLDRYFPNEEERQRVNLEFDNFFANKGFSEVDSFPDRWELIALTWWAKCGAATPLLQKLALKLLSQPCSSWCSDPNWCSESPEQKGGSRVVSQQDQDLMFVQMNLKAKTLQQQFCENRTSADMYGNSFDSDSNT